MNNISYYNFTSHEDSTLTNNQDIAASPIFRTHSKEDSSRDFGITIDELRAFFTRMRNSAL